LLVLDLPGTRPLRPIRNGLATIVSPIGALGGAILSPVRNGWKGAFNYDDVKKQRDQLQADLDERKSQDAIIEQQKREIEQLEKMAGVKVEGEKWVLGEIVSGPVSNFDQTVQINRGSNDGIGRGMAVLTGRTDGSDGALIGGQSVGVAAGQGTGRNLVIDGITGIVPKKGDAVSTSLSESSQFPRGLVIGTITKVTEGSLSTSVEVKPLADLSGTYVKVVLVEPPP
jgi:cell shape-determining protein MreC